MPFKTTNVSAEKRYKCSHELEEEKGASKFVKTSQNKVYNHPEIRYNAIRSKLQGN